MRRIEDLKAELVAAIAHLDSGGTADPDALRARIDARIAEINRLVDAHNHWYPIEANLPIDVPTGRLLDRGEPWRPLAPWTLASLRARATGG